MRKLLSLFSCLTILGSGASSLASCGTPNGNAVPFYIYNDSNFSNIIHNPSAEGTKNNIFDASINTDAYQFQAEQESNNEYKISLSSNLLMPLMTGINLSSDNTKNTDGAKWSSSQIGESLFSQKTNLENNDPTWTDFFNQFSSQEDTYFTQVALLASKNKNIAPLTTVPNVDKISDKDLMNTSDNQLGPSLYALNPVSKALDELDSSKLNLSPADNNDFLIQNAAYALYSIGSVTFTFEFSGINNKYWSFNVTVNNVAAKFQFLTFPNPNYKSSSKNPPPEYIHQWFFTGYDFYDQTHFVNSYSSKDNPNNAVYSGDPNLVIGYVNVNSTATTQNTNYTYSQDESPKIGSKGEFSPTQLTDANSSITFPWLVWLIKADSIQANDGSSIN